VLKTVKENGRLEVQPIPFGPPHFLFPVSPNHNTPLFIFQLVPEFGKAFF